MKHDKQIQIGVNCAGIAAHIGEGELDEFGLWDGGASFELIAEAGVALADVEHNASFSWNDSAIDWKSLCGELAKLITRGTLPEEADLRAFIRIACFPEKREKSEN